MSENKSLVEYVSEAANVNTSIARRWIIEGRVKVNDEVVDDVAARIPPLPRIVEIDKKETTK